MEEGKHLNCWHQVIMSAGGKYGLSEETMYEMGKFMGGGLAGRQGTCGALSSAALIFGLRYTSQQEGLEAVNRFLNEASEKFGSTVCREIREKAGERRLCPFIIKFAQDKLKEITEESSDDQQH